MSLWIRLVPRLLILSKELRTEALSTRTVLCDHVVHVLAHTVEMTYSDPVHLFPLSDAPVSELSLELLLLQVVLPALLEQGHTRQWLKGLVRAWTVSAGYLL